MSITIRSLTEGDLKAADAILRTAFQRSESFVNDLRLFQTLQPGGIFLAYQNEMPAGIVASIIYSNYAYVGLMGVHLEFQRQGVGLALMQHLLAWLDQQGVHQVVLDASPFGQPLYAKLDFVALDEVYVLQRRAGLPSLSHPNEVKALTLQNLDLITATDKQAFGADRGRLLQALVQINSDRAFLLPNAHNGIAGYLISQEKRIGPWVMQNQENAEPLLRAALAKPFHHPVSVVVPSENMDAVKLLQVYGFEIVRVNRHMVRGSFAVVRDRLKIFAQTSLSFG